MNNINQQQNESSAIDKLAAQRQLYTKAKIFFAWRVIASIAIAIIGPFLIAKFDASRSYVALFSIVYIIFDIIVLKKIESNTRDSAAKIQELFDIGLFNLEWNSVVLGNKPDMETICVNNEKYRKKNDAKLLMNWYPSKIETIDIIPATLICQRSNIWWDVNLRKSYTWILSALLFISIATFLTISVVKNFDIQKMLEYILPILPLLSILIEQIESQIATISKIESLKEKIESLIEAVINSGHKKSDLAKKIRTIQDEIYRHRKSCFSLPDWLHFIFVNKYENQMVYNAEIHISRLSNRVE